MHALFAYLQNGDAGPLRAIHGKTWSGARDVSWALGKLLLGDKPDCAPEVRAAAEYIQARPDGLRDTLQYLLDCKCGEARGRVEQALRAGRKAAGVCPFDGRTEFVAQGPDTVSCPRRGHPPHVPPQNRGLWQVLTGPLNPRPGDLDILATLAPLERSSVVVDVGCGLGSYALPIARRLGKGGRVFAVDQAQQAIDYVAWRAAREGVRNVVAHKGRAEKLDLERGVADVILIVDVHLFDPPSAYARTHGPFRSIYDTLKKGGRLLIVSESSFLPPPNLYESLAKDAGFRLRTRFDRVSIHYQSGRRRFWAFEK
ncbi:MAG: class I SAM-dependent methyltransferase [Armatimonadetes bacterium]|nr:class I SAM-dependent methyltransferase [Armatimonadota bacterium]MBM4437865.1 class I SAM-dependent methyltransferase [Actinomycetota bacterium]